MPSNFDITKFHIGLKAIIRDYGGDVESLHISIDQHCLLELKRLGYGESVGEIKRQILWYS